MAHVMLDIAQSAAVWDPQDPKAYMVQEGPPVSDTLKNMLGPPCDKNRDATHKLQLKNLAILAKDPAKAAMKVEMWRFQGDGTMSVNATSVIKYIYTGRAHNFARTQQRLFREAMIPHKLLQVPKVRTLFKFYQHNSLYQYFGSNVSRKLLTKNTVLILVLETYLN